MSLYQNALQDQIKLIEEAMKQAGLWSEETPDWIIHYQEGPIVNIWQWLQFIHLPLRVNGSLQKSLYLAPQISHYMNLDATYRDILKLVIELDSITSTLHKT